MHFNQSLAIMALMAVVGTTPLHAQEKNTGETGIAVGAIAPGAKLETLDGAPADLAAYLGKSPVLITFWATWCPHCKALEPVLRAAYATHGKQVRFLNVAVSASQTAGEVRRYVGRHHLPGLQLYDRKGAATNAYDVPGTSFVVLVNTAGKVAYTGLGEKQPLDSALTRLR